jgi:peptidoglycan/LPS O-acetylase OafA/YrhL
MPGGFVGVDVFFVISGYLISGIIIKQAKKSMFSIVDFYERRVKRIYPALILMMIFTLTITYKAYSYSQLKTTANTMAASSIFSANL